MVCVCYSVVCMWYVVCCVSMVCSVVCVICMCCVCGVLCCVLMCKCVYLCHLLEWERFQLTQSADHTSQRSCLYLSCSILPEINAVVQQCPLYSSEQEAKKASFFSSY